MGAIQSRQRYREAAYDAFENAQEIQHDLGGPRIWGAILAYIDGRINAERLIRLCTQIEVNEFTRLAGPVVQEWVNRHEQHFRCDAGRRGVCSYPRDNPHFHDCGYYRPLPPELEIPFESIGQSHGHAFRSQDAEAQYYDNEFFDGYDDEYFNFHNSRGHLFHSRHEDEENDHVSHVFHGRFTDEYDESHLNASHFDADFSNGEGLTGHNNSRTPSHSHPRTRSYNDDLTNEYVGSSEGFRGSDSSYLCTDNQDFSGGDDSIPAAFGRPRGPTAANRGSSGTANRPETRPNVHHRHHGRDRVSPSSANNFEDDQPTAREPIDGRRGPRVRVPTTRGRGERRGVATRPGMDREDSARTDFASDANRGPARGGAQARGSHRGGHAPPNARRTTHTPNITPNAVPASDHVSSAAGARDHGQRDAAPARSTAIPRRHTHFQDTTDKSEDSAEYAASVEVINRKFNSMRFEGFSE